MLASFSRHLRHLTGVIEDLSFKDVPQRLATDLLKLSNPYCTMSSNGATPNNVVTLDLPKSQLATALGTVPATLCRAFYFLSSEGLMAASDS